MQRQILATARRDLGDAQMIPQVSGSVEADFKEINPAHALLRDDRRTRQQETKLLGCYIR